METNNSEITRKMYITIDKTNEFREFDSHATTLGELKAELKAIGISYEGCSFMEANSMATYDIDESVFPEETVSPVTGQKTKDLAFILVSKNKNLNSGRSTSAVSLDRRKACQLIKDNGYEDRFTNKYGKKPFNAKTDDIYAFLIEVKLDDQIEVEKLDKFGNRVKGSKAEKVVKPATASKKEEEPVKEVVEEPIEETIEETNIVEEVETSLVAGGVVEPSNTSNSKEESPVVYKPRNKTECGIVNQCNKLIDKIGLAAYTIFKQEATKEDLIDLIESQPEAVQKEIMNILTERLVPKPTYSAEFMRSQMDKARRLRK